MNGKDRRTDLERVRNAFDAWADTYEAAVAEGAGVLRGYGRSRELATALVQVQPGARVVDIGIGTGAFAEIFARQGAEITGVDLSPRMLEICASRHPEWRLLQGDFQHIPLDAGSQDLVVTSFAFHELERADREAAVAECMRVLRPAGRLLLVDIMFTDASELQRERERLLDSWDEENYALSGELRELARKLGLKLRLRSLSDLHGATLFWRG